MTLYRFSAVVRQVEHRFERQHVSGTADKAIFRNVSTGWWVIFQGWPASMFFGLEKPDFEEGDTIDLTAAKRGPGTLTLPIAPPPTPKNIAGGIAYAEIPPPLPESGLIQRVQADLQREEARAKGYEGDECRECGHFSLLRNGTCLKCDTCGATTGCS